MNNWKKLWQTIKKPPVGVYVLTYVLTLITVACSIICLILDFQQNLLINIVSCTVFALSAIGLTYSVYLIVISRKAFKPMTIRILNKFTLTRILLDYVGYRKFFFMIWSFVLTFGYASINLFLGLSLNSIWYCSLAAYNVFLLLMRGSILLYHNNRRKNKNRSITEDKLSQVKTYLTCGIFLSVLNIALSVAIAEVIFHDMHYNYYSWTIYAFAAFTFYKITMAIYRKIRYRKQPDLTERAARSFNLAGACFSVMGLQTALLSTFANDNLNISLYNTITGLAVSIITVTLSFIMVYNGIRRYRKTKMELQNEQV
ncbi:MAG: hypothetical protein IJW47_02205 [Clostridia bacterium]|nr:hypothetical protein [Clostridia bacterium]